MENLLVPSRRFHDESSLCVGRNGGAHGVVGQHARGDEASSASEGSEWLGDHHGEDDLPG
jgi:hypothetical protein